MFDGPFLIPEVSLFGHDEMRLPKGPFLNPSANPLGKIANPTHLIVRSLACSEQYFRKGINDKKYNLFMLAMRE